MRLASIDVGLKRIGIAICLDGNLDIEVAYQDEQSSSIEAKELTRGLFRHQKDGKIDSIAAKIILERWLQR